MLSLESKIEIIPEKSEIKIPITISGIDDIKFLPENGYVIIKSSAETVEMIFNKTESQNIRIPDLKEPIKGTLTLYPDTSVIELRDIPIDEAMDLIREYIQKNPGSLTSDILCDLGIDIEIGLKALGQLKQKELVNSEELHGST